MPDVRVTVKPGQLWKASFHGSVVCTFILRRALHNPNHWTCIDFKDDGSTHESVYSCFATHPDMWTLVCDA